MLPYYSLKRLLMLRHVRLSFTLAYRSCAQCGWTIWIWLGSIFAFFLAVVAYGLITSFNPAFYYTPEVTWNLPEVWLQIILIPVICVLIDTIYNFLVEEFRPSPVNLGVEQNR